MLSEPPDADPHVRWCGGRRGEPGAYPITAGAFVRSCETPARDGQHSSATAPDTLLLLP